MTNNYIEKQLTSISEDLERLKTNTATDLTLLNNKVDTLLTALQLNCELSNNRVLDKKQLSKEIEANGAFISEDKFKNSGELEIARRIGEHLKQYDNFRQLVNNDDFKEQLAIIVMRKKIPEKEFIKCLKRVNDSQGVKDITKYTYKALENIDT